MVIMKKFLFLFFALFFYLKILSNPEIVHYIDFKKWDKDNEDQNKIIVKRCFLNSIINYILELNEKNYLICSLDVNTKSLISTAMIYSNPKIDENSNYETLKYYLNKLIKLAEENESK
jgi:hypothetical protein